MNQQKVGLRISPVVSFWWTRHIGYLVTCKWMGMGAGVIKSSGFLSKGNGRTDTSSPVVFVDWGDPNKDGWVLCSDIQIIGTPPESYESIKDFDFSTDEFQPWHQEYLLTFQSIKDDQTFCILNEYRGVGYQQPFGRTFLNVLTPVPWDERKEVWGRLEEAFLKGKLKEKPWWAGR